MRKMKKHTFLGISSTGDFPNIDILIDNQKLIRKLRDNGMCDAFGYPTSIKRLLCKPIEDITTYGNQVLRGLVNNNQGCRNDYVMHRIQYIIQYSIAYTIARKCDISKYHKQLIYSYMNDKGRELALYRSFKRDKTFFHSGLVKSSRMWNTNIEIRILSKETVTYVAIHNIMSCFIERRLAYYVCLIQISLKK